MSLTLSRERHGVLADCLASSAEPVAQSARFALYDLDEPPRSIGGSNGIVVVHDFASSEIDNNIGGFVAYELMPLLASLPAQGGHDGYTLSEQQIFERFVGAIVRSADDNEQRAWHRFYDNTLSALDRAERLPGSANGRDDAPMDFIATFAAIYDRAIDLIAEAAPETWLDAATCFGFLPFHLARKGRASPQADGRLPGEIFACDVDVALVSLAQDYSTHERLCDVRFFCADVLAPDFTSERRSTPARFDVVTAIHVFEHLEPVQTVPALRALWSCTGRRLVIAVPIEDTPDPRFGHRQVFDVPRLRALGDHLDGCARAFEDRGAWLVIDRPPQRDNSRERTR